MMSWFSRFATPSPRNDNAPPSDSRRRGIPLEPFPGTLPDTSRITPEPPWRSTRLAPPLARRTPDVLNGGGQYHTRNAVSSVENERSLAGKLYFQMWRLPRVLPRGQRRGLRRILRPRFSKVGVGGAEPLPPTKKECGPHPFQAVCCVARKTTQTKGLAHG